MKFPAIACLVALLSVGARAAEPARVNATTQPHVFRFTLAEDIAGLNPVLLQQDVVNTMGQLAMAWLFRYDRSNRPEPELATVVPSEKNGGISADGKTITYHIRKNVKWSDGRPFDADDVVFSFSVMNNPANNITSRDGFDLIEKIDEPDKATVVVHMRRPYSPFIPTFFATGAGNPCLLPKHILGTLPNINQAAYNELPVGIGPFRFSAWRHGEAVEFEPNPYYWRGLPKLKKIVYKIIPDRNTTLTQLQTGELDMWYPVGGVYLPRVQAIRTVDLIRQPGYLYNHLDFNLTRPVLQDKVVREALRLALDRTLLHDKVGHGLGFLQESVVPAPYPGLKKIPFVAFDIGKANAMLDAAGWKRGSDGIRAKNGMRLSLDFASSSGTPDVDTQVEIIRTGWQQIGAEINVKRFLASSFFEPADAGGVLYGGKFDAVVYSWGVGSLDDLYNNFGCESAPPKGQNIMHYCNRELDPIMRDFQTHYDSGRQAADLDKAAAIIASDVPTIVTNSREDVFAFNKDLKNFHPNNVTYFDDMMDVDI